MSKANVSFSERMEAHQVSWAYQSGLSDLLEPRKDKTPSWVLKKMTRGNKFKRGDLVAIHQR